ncbi:hypothetical protein DM02DRAFT_586349 [Periconia macrospinosa]|uniref:Benzoylformate decarboxylase n=1 Tax=Periconia macrospinosa TaxID=97972 RepID=A0A2V1E1G2_9PLEO|nr:hypothetical protein DM02DRAFT_586349 [Periconia macrospinosa]
MSIQHLRSMPKAADFTPLQEHQEQTPSTFFGAKPVLHAHYSGLSLSAPAAQLKEHAVFAMFASSTPDDSENALVQNIEIWVNSEDLILYENSPNNTGVKIPYPSIALHATLKHDESTEALLLNVSLNDASTVNSAEEICVLELRILPPGVSHSRPQNDCIKEIYAAMNTCADLHPDPDDGDEDGMFDETAPGATGWITAENMGDFMDADGNFTGTVIGGEEELGPGAGTVRQREEDESHDGQNGVNGEQHQDKYQRTAF